MTLPDTPFDPILAGAAPRRPLRGRRLLAVAGATVGVVLALLPTAALANRPKPGFEPTLPLANPVQPPAAGAIFNVNAGYAGLVEGNRAHAVGDALAIVLVESLSTSKTAVGKTQKSGSFAFTPPSKGPLSLLDSNALNASGNSAFNGQGNAAQTSSLGGTVEVTIAQVRPNGTALVKGEKRLLLSQGEEWVQVSGIVRFADITPDNTVQSTQVADARIVYTGNGSIGRASREGWLGKFFSIINPF